MNSAPAGFEEGLPYTIALVTLDEGPTVTAQLTDLGEKEVAIGMPVEIVARRIKEDGGKQGILVYGYKLRSVMG